MTDTILGGMVDLNLYDDDGSILDWNENLLLQFDDGEIYGFPGGFEVDTKTYTYSIPIHDLLDGKLTMRMMCTAGDFYYNWSSLNVFVDREYPEAMQPVPEPATMLLVSIGLTGLAGFGRKKVLKRPRLRLEG